MKRNKLRKLLALGLSASLALTVLAGCSTTTGDDTGSPAPDSTGSPDTRRSRRPPASGRAGAKRASTAMSRSTCSISSPRG